MTAPPSAEEVERRSAWRSARQRGSDIARRILADCAVGRISRYQPGWRWYVPWVSFTGRVLSLRNHLIGETR